MNIWHTLSKPFFILAPMEDVTDTVFRQVVIKCGRPDLFFTEFTNVDGMLSVGRKSVMQRLIFTEKEKPLIAQIWGNTPENYAKAARMVKKMGFDGVDINMGCPVKSMIKKGFCSGLIRNPKLAQDLIKTTKEAVGSFPVSVKTRIGFDTIQTKEWISALLEIEPVALSIHGRTVKEQSSVPAHWDEIGKARELRDTMKKNTLIVGNGDVLSKKQGEELAQQYKLDGIMIGRGIFRNLWVFDEAVDPTTRPLDYRLHLLIDHINLFRETWGEEAHFDRMKKYYKIYFSGLPGAAVLRNDLMQYDNAEDTLQHLNDMLSNMTNK